jgi:Flp pilus assembly protein TadG
MKRKRKNRILPFWGRDDGTVAVEFVILFPLFLLIVVGIVEFGHLWYVDHVITNAAREGARVGVVYTTGTDGSALPAPRIQEAQTNAIAAVNNYLKPNGKSIIPGVTWQINPNPPPVTTYTNPVTGVTTLSGGTLTVTITATNVALVLDQVIPAFKNMTLTAVTTMRME